MMGILSEFNHFRGTVTQADSVGPNNPDTYDITAFDFDLQLPYPVSLLQGVQVTIVVQTGGNTQCQTNVLLINRGNINVQ